jgi:hypothetical protein
MKPDIGAPGRYMIGAVPANSVLTKLKPTNVKDALRGYIQLSGTSFAAPVVAATAAMLLASIRTGRRIRSRSAQLTATKQLNVKGGALGVGDVNVAAARYLYKSSIPNPNAGLDKFVKAAADGTNVFDPAAWQAAAKTSKAWNDAAWSDAAWSDAAWASAAWSDVAWADAAWASVAWGSAGWSDAAWSDAAWADAAWADNAGDAGITTGNDATQADQDALAAQFLCDPLLTQCSVSAPGAGYLP